MILAPFNGLEPPYFSRRAMRPGISSSEISISLRPKAARPMSATLYLRAGPDIVNASDNDCLNGVWFLICGRGEKIGEWDHRIGVFFLCVANWADQIAHWLNGCCDGVARVFFFVDKRPRR